MLVDGRCAAHCNKGKETLLCGMQQHLSSKHSDRAMTTLICTGWRQLTAAVLSEDLTVTSNQISKSCRTAFHLLPVISSIYSKNLFLKPLVFQHTSERLVMNCKHIKAHGLHGDLVNNTGIADVLCCLPNSSN